MIAFYFCNGEDTACSKTNCHKTGGDCEHTTDRTCAREMECPRLFEEVEPGVLFEIDPDRLLDTLAGEGGGGG